jgi:hypothetical protein
MSKKVLFVNQDKLFHDRLKNYPSLEKLILDTYPDWHFYQKIPRFNTHANLYFRGGADSFPFHLDETDFLNAAMPQFDPTFDLSFSEVCDLRSQELLKTHSDRPWRVLWSGGTDSTTVLVSILRNTTRAERQNIFVACNRISVYENPRFFYDHILPNFPIVDSSATILDKQILEQYYYFDGQPADHLYSGKFPQSMLLHDPTSFTRNIKTDPDRLLDFITDKVDKDFAEWFYSIMLTNINSSDVPIETYHDFFWWSQFNISWVNSRTFPFTRGVVKHTAIRSYVDNYTQWYDSKEYQLWAMRNNSEGIKYGTTVGEYKLSAKKYIYEYTKDEYFYKFKTKMGSGGYISPDSDDSLFCLLDDYSALTLDKDLEQILELLPTHMNRG